MPGFTGSASLPQRGNSYRGDRSSDASPNAVIVPQTAHVRRADREALEERTLVDGEAWL